MGQEPIDPDAYYEVEFAWYMNPLCEGTPYSVDSPNCKLGSNLILSCLGWDFIDYVLDTIISGPYDNSECT